MSFVITLRLKRRGALSNDSPSCSRTSAIFIAPSQQDIRHIGTYFLCATIRRTVALLLLPLLGGNRRSRIFIFALWSCDFEFPMGSIAAVRQSHDARIRQPRAD